jgi:hypothetical protein
MFSITGNSTAAERWFDNLAASQVPFANVVALTRTAIEIRAAEQAEMRSVFDRPTPFSLNAFQVEPATKARPEARIEQKYATGTSRPRNWFDPNVFGGERRPKGYEQLLRRAGVLPDGLFTIPGRGAKLDAYGNISRAQLVQILSDLRSSRDGAADMTDRSRRRNKRERHYVSKTNGSVRGIAIRSKGVPVLVLKFIGSPAYAPVFDFFGVAERKHAEVYPLHFDAALAQAIASAR